MAELTAREKAQSSIAENRKAFHDYHLLETFEAGLVLLGTEVKAIREGRVNLRDSFARVEGGEVFLYNVHISPYSHRGYADHEPLRRRKLLLHKREIRKLIGKTVEKGMTLHSYWTTKCSDCPLKPKCTTSNWRRIKRWEHEAAIDAMQDRLDRAPTAMRVRRQTVEHPFGTLKSWMGATHFLTKTLEKVRTEMSLHVLAYNLKRVIAILGVAPLKQAMRA